MKTTMQVRHNVLKVHSIESFWSVKGGINQNCKDVYFVRLLGVHPSFQADVGKMDTSMTARAADGKAAYQRIGKLPILSDPKDVSVYEGFYNEWTLRQKETVTTKILKENYEYSALLANGLRKVLELFSANGGVSASMEKNFAVKILFWHDFLLADTLTHWEAGMSVKLVLSNIVKKQEYLFSYFLTLLGFDVLLLQSEADIGQQEEQMGLSQKTVLGGFSKADLPAYDREKCKPAPTAEQNPNPFAQGAAQREARTPVSLARPSSARKAVHPRTVEAEQEKTFEQLALLASSVVLIAIHDRKGDVIGTGSGIMVGKDGYILTNNHVARGGAYYSIRIEEDENVYTTDELIKYHSVIDLAILRIDRRLNPLPIYRGGKPLARGQKVVAIGSPLGLFNSVSDGIISGFRKIDGVDMIQFTAPTSHGSSGGALLDMYGTVIGISTAGFDNAQNINLAVGYESIRQFLPNGIMG